MKPVKAHHMSFPVKDLDKSQAFYRDILGLEQIPRPDIFPVPGLWFQAGACEVHLIQVEEGFDVGEPPKTTNPIARHAAFAIDDYDETLAFLKDTGLTVFETNADVGQMWIADPDGHVIELIKPAS
ncbi:MAG: VOC family protein [Sphingorhabdus sp.]